MTDDSEEKRKKMKTLKEEDSTCLAFFVRCDQISINRQEANAPVDFENGKRVTHKRKVPEFSLQQESSKTCCLP